MSSPRVEPVPVSEAAGLGRLFLLIVLIETLVIAALYWFGAYFS